MTVSLGSTEVFSRILKLTSARNSIFDIQGLWYLMYYQKIFLRVLLCFGDHTTKNVQKVGKIWIRVYAAYTRFRDCVYLSLNHVYGVIKSKYEWYNLFFQSLWSTHIKNINFQCILNQLFFCWKSRIRGVYAAYTRRIRDLRNIDYKKFFLLFWGGALKKMHLMILEWRICSWAT